MTSALQDARVALTLDRMHSEAERTDPPLLEKAEGKSLAERAALFGDAFIPVDRDAGRLLYTLVRGSFPGTVVEFDRTETLFTNPSDQRTVDYVTGRFG